ncbi:MAG: hypothetical protein JNJ61_11535 [Anaerolineae bacterium]|nr:hypothetical protein [Anaerolineae bacterium]
MSANADPILARSIGFDDDDLRQNRAGRLSVAQAQRLQSAQTKTGYGLIGVAGLLSLLMLPIALGVASSGDILSGLIIGFIGLGIIGALVMISRQDARKLAADIASGHVETAQGLIQCYTTSSESTRYNLRMGELLFMNVPQTLYIGFKHLEPYTLYYTPNTLQIVAAEPGAQVN